MDAFIQNESIIRPTVFLSLFILMALLETFKPRRKRSFTRKERWFSNLGILVLSAITARIILPWVPVGVAIYAQNVGLGLLNQISIPQVPILIIGVLLLDLLIYFQHVVMHKVPIFWRLHRLHHADLDYDVTTGIRFHPIEIILSLLYKMGLIVLLGIEPVSVIIFEIILNGMAMFNHANFHLPLGLDKVLRLVFVTPDVHRVHHSSIQSETDSNYGFNVIIWDRIFQTYCAQPKLGHDDMEIGLNYFRDKSQLKIHHMLTQPFRRTDT